MRWELHESFHISWKDNTISNPRNYKTSTKNTFIIRGVLLTILIKGIVIIYLKYPK